MVLDLKGKHNRSVFKEWSCPFLWFSLRFIPYFCQAPFSLLGLLLSIPSDGTQDRNDLPSTMDGSRGQQWRFYPLIKDGESAALHMLLDITTVISMAIMVGADGSCGPTTSRGSRVSHLCPRCWGAFRLKWNKSTLQNKIQAAPGGMQNANLFCLWLTTLSPLQQWVPKQTNKSLRLY